MKVHKINFLPGNYNVSKPEIQEQNLGSERRINSYNPHAYMDYNISFTERLFRTPANFYSTPFNKNGMPETMKAYLNDDYDDRRNMPPIQMWKTVFAQINEAEDLNDVKRFYPEEPLFDNLKDFKGKAKDSVIGEIQALEDEFDSTPLFKDGSSNFGLYLLKKVYYDGKGLNEINKDFKNDINDEYKGLIEKDINNSTTRAFGIKYPNLAFWNSFVVTRDDFPYVYKPKKALNTSENERKIPAENTSPRPKIEKKKFEKIKDWEVNKLADALIKGKGSKTETNKRIRKSNIQDEDSLNFAAKYFGEINSIVNDRLHVSEEMIDYFNNYDNLDKTQQEKFEAYWKNPQLNKLQSILMKDTIKLFFDAYGADGNNEEFQNLLEYAHNIKPERMKKQEEHLQLQQEYENALGIFEEPEKINTSSDNNVMVEFDDDDDGDKLAHYQKLFDNLKKEYDVDSYDFDTEIGRVTIVSNLKEALAESIQSKYDILPKQFVNKYLKFVLSQSDIINNNGYILTTLLNEKGIKLPQDDRLISAEQAEEITCKLYQEFSDTNKKEQTAAQQALIDNLIGITDAEIAPELFRFGALEFPEIIRDDDPKIIDFLHNKSSQINKNYNEYKQPLSISEAYKAALSIIDLLRRYNPENTINKFEVPFKGANTIINAMSVFVRSKNNNDMNNFKKDLITFLQEYGGAARFLLKKDVPENLRMAKMEQILIYTLFYKQDFMMFHIFVNDEASKILKNELPELYNTNVDSFDIANAKHGIYRL